MKTIFPNKLKHGDNIMVVAPSDSLANINDDVSAIAKQRFSDMGLKVSFAKNVTEIDELDSSKVESRVADLHEAFANKDVQGIFTSFGGYNCNQLLKYLDFDLIKRNPKLFIGFSDTTALQNSIFTKTGLVTYSGPSYSRFGQELYFDYTLEYFKKCIFETEQFKITPSKLWSDDWWLTDQTERTLVKSTGWQSISEGCAIGRILGANLSTFNLLQGTEYFPDISGSILFLEDDSESNIGHFDRDLQSLIHLPNFNKVKGLVIGRFQNESKITAKQLTRMVESKNELRHIPVLANVDFGHTDPLFTFPIGGEVELYVSSEKSTIKIVKH